MDKRPSPNGATWGGTLPGPAVLDPAILDAAAGPITYVELHAALVKAGALAPGGNESVIIRRLSQRVYQLKKRGVIPADRIIADRGRAGVVELDNQILYDRINEIVALEPKTVRDIHTELAHPDLSIAKVSDIVSRMKRYDILPPDRIIDSRFSVERTKLKEAIIKIVAELQPITCRGVWYQLVGMGLIDKTSEAANQQPKYVSEILVELRDKKIIPYTSIVDMTREFDIPLSFDNPSEGLDFLARQYSRNLWQGRPDRVQVWIEKRGLSGVVAEVTRELHTPMLPTGGNNSVSLHFEAAEMVKRHDGPTYIYLIGDHDASGRRMDYTNADRMKALAPDSQVVFQRIAIMGGKDEKPNQIKQYNLPTREPNELDPCHKWFAEKFGTDCCEVDSLDPRILRKLVRDAIMRHLPQDHVDRVRAQGALDIENLKATADGF